MTSVSTPSVLFVCLGNICRSPLAEAAMRAAALGAGLDLRVDSAGTGDWHAGSPPDPRATATALRHGIDISGLRARQIVRDDFTRFNLILALDGQNLRDLQRIRPAPATARLALLLEFVPGNPRRDVADPYFGDEAGFEQTWADVAAAAASLVRHFAAQE